MPISFAALPIWVNLGLLAGASIVVWIAGVRLSRIGDVLAKRTGLGRALFGLLFLAAATSLPEVATTVTATVSGNASLATNNLLGGVVLQTAVLAIGDGVLRTGALTYFSPKPVLLLQGTLLVVLLGLVLAVTSVGEIVTVGWIGGGSALVFVVWVASLILLRAENPGERWQPVDVPDMSDAEEARAHLTQPYRKQGTRALFGWFGLGAAIVLAAGVVLATVADAIATQTGIGSSFVGATLLAGSTSLPDISITVAAVRIGAYSMAISNIFGSNSLMLALVFVADVTYTPGPILDEVDRSVVFAAAAGVVVTAIYLAGLIERRDHRVWRLGIDSVLVVALYLVTLVVLWTLR